MAVIDERVVEMKFDRADFLKGTEETLGALQRLEDSLGAGGAIASGVGHIGSAFGILGNIGMGALLKIGSSAVEAGMSVVNNVLNPIREGGKRRAMNLEQADFMLNNLLGSEEAVAAVMANVSYAVSGTAYGLDAAAVAAAQFAASGVQAGTEMENALRGISGVAAMGGREYEQVSTIFTKIAGQGRVMGDDLNRVGAMGINAAQTMAEYFNELHGTTTYTESSIREMVTKGKVDFNTFAAAMDGAFGEDAKRANEMYSGSLSNVRAALSRVGAAFYEVYLEKQRRTFVALIPVIDAVKKVIDPLFNLYEQFVAIPAAKNIEKWSSATQTWLSNNLVPLRVILGELFMIGIKVRDAFMSWVKPVGAAFKAVFASGDGGGWLNTIGDILTGARKGIEGLTATAEQQTGVTDFFIKIFEAAKTLIGYIGTAFDAVGSVVEWFWDKFKVGLDYVKEGFDWLQPILQSAWDSLLEAGPKIKAFFDEFRTHLDETGSIFETVGHFAGVFYDRYIVPLVDGVKGLRDSFVVLRTEGLDAFKASMGDTLAPFQSLWDWVKETTGLFGSFGDAVDSTLGWFREKLPAVSTLIETLFGYVSGQMTGFAGAIDGVFAIIGSVLGGIADSFTKLFENVDGQDLIELAEALGKLATVILMYKTLKSLQGTFDSISGFFGSLSTQVEAFGERAAAAAKTNTFLKVAISIAILAGALWLLSTIPADKLLASVVTLAAVSAMVGLLVLAMSKVDSPNIVATAGGLVLLAMAISGMAVAMLLLGLVPMDTLMQGMFALMMITTMLTTLAFVVGKFAPNLNIAAIGLLLLVGAITLMIIPIQLLGEMDHMVLAQGLLGVLAALALLVAAAIIIGEYSEQMLLGAAAMIVMAGAITLMVIPIQMLGEMDMPTMVQGLIGIGIGLALMALAAQAMEENLKGAAGILILAAALVILAYGISLLAAIPFLAAAGGMLILVIALGALVGAAALAGLVLPGILGLAGLMLAFAAAAIAVALAVLIFASSAQILADGLPGLADALAYFGEQMAQAEPMGFKMMALGVVLAVFGAGAFVAGVGVGILGIGMMALGIGMMLVAAAGDEAGPVLASFLEAIAPLWKQTLKLAAVAVAVALLGAAVFVLGVGLVVLGAGIAAMGLGAIILALGMGAMLLASMGIEKIVTEFEKLPRAAVALAIFQTSLAMVTPMFADFAVKVNSARNALRRFTSVSERLSTQFPLLADAMEANAQSIVDSVSVIGPGLTESVAEIQDSSDQIVTSLTTMSSRIKAAAPEVSTSISDMAGQIVSQMQAGASEVEIGKTQIVSAFDGIESGLKDRIGVIEYAARDLMQYLVAALADGKSDVQAAVKTLGDEVGKLADSILQNRSKITNAVEAVGDSVVSTLRNQRDRVYNSAKYVGGAVASGMAAGIRGGSSTVSTAARRVAQSAIDSAEDTLGIRSPSKVFYDMMSWVIKGMVLSAEDNQTKVETAGSMLGMALSNSVRSSMSDVSAEFDNFQIVPTISPTLDMEGVRNQASALVGLEARFSAVQAQGLLQLDEALRGVSIDAEREANGGVTFIQNNNSPKSLSRAEIYRDTKNLISQRERGLSSNANGNRSF